MARIKICGLRREQDIEYVNELKPDYAGFILTDGFRRSIGIDMMRQLRSQLCSDIKAVGVFVDDDADKINALVSEGLIDMVQLHGRESTDYCGRINAPVIKYFRPDMFDTVHSYDTQYFLFDSGTGTGTAFDWSAIPCTDRPFFLAGGMNANNIKKALDEINPYCIDVSSAVETDGNKDYHKIKQIIDIIRNGEQR